MITWKPSLMPVFWEFFSYIRICVKYKCWPSTASGRSMFGSWKGLSYQAEFLHLTCRCFNGDEFLIGGFSFSSRLPLCMASVFHIWKLDHMCLIMSILKVDICFDRVCDGVGEGFAGISSVDVMVIHSY